MNQPNPMPADHVALAVVGATKECPNYSIHVWNRECGLCFDTGRVRVFADATGMRARCVDILYEDMLVSHEDFPKDYPLEGCLNCHGLGYTATDRLEVLLEVGAVTGRVSDYSINLITLGSARPKRIRFRAFCLGETGDGYEAIEACYNVLAMALVAQGAELGPTGKEVSA